MASRVSWQDCPARGEFPVKCWAMKVYRVRLTPEERAQLQELLSKGKAAARTLTHARILLKADEGVAGPRLTDDAIAEALDVNRSTVERVRIRCVEEGFEAALRPRPSRQLHPRKLDGVQEAHLVALACSPAPKGRGALVAAPAGRQAGGTGDRGRHLVRDRAADAQKNELKPWLKQQYCLPEAPSGEFVYHMEDVLDVYTRPYDPRRPQVCLDETSVQLIGEKRTPLPTGPRSTGALRLRVRAQRRLRPVHAQRAAARLARGGRC